MRTIRSLPFGLAFLALAALALPSAAGPDGAADDCKHGPAKGVFELPSPAGPGAFHAVLGDGDGHPKFVVLAKVTPGDGPGKGGKLEGVLFALTGDDEKTPVAAVRGEWKLGDGMNGGLHAVFLKPSDAGPKKIGGMKGKFHIGSAGKGPFMGHWAICKP